MSPETLKMGGRSQEMRHVQHEINSALFALNTANQKLTSSVPDNQLAVANLRSAISRLEVLSRQLGDALKEANAKQVEDKV